MDAKELQYLSKADCAVKVAMRYEGIRQKLELWELLAGVIGKRPNDGTAEYKRMLEGFEEAKINIPKMKAELLEWGSVLHWLTKGRE